MHNKIKIVLFDLDGTLLDTAPDLGFALNTLMKSKKMTPVPLSSIKEVASRGSRGLIHLGFGLNDSHPDYSDLKKEFLNIYSKNLAEKTVMFHGMSEVLDYLDKNKITWGIVTNKPEHLTKPLLKKLNLDKRPACIVGGDTTAHPKPHPAPLQHACKLLSCEPSDCIFIGDASQDIEAGRRAGMTTMVANYGYIGPSDNPQSWGANHYIDKPEGIIQWLESLSPSLSS